MASSSSISKSFHRLVLVAFMLQVLVSLGLYLATDKLVEKHEHVRLASDIIASERFELQSAFLMSSLIELDLEDPVGNASEITAWQTRLRADIAALDKTRAALAAVRDSHLQDGWFPVDPAEAAFERSAALENTILQFHAWFDALGAANQAALPALFTAVNRPEGDHHTIAAFLDGSSEFLAGVVARTSDHAAQIEAMIATGHVITVLLCGFIIFVGVRPAARRLAAALAREDAYRRRLRDQATTDPLTGVGNRKALEEYLAARLPVGDGFAFCTVDLNRFKPVNDAYGHDAGDAVLLEIASRLTAAVGGRGLVVRLGGDEFGCLLEGVSNVAAARALGETLVRVFTAPIRYQDHAFEVGASIGVALDRDVAGGAAAVITASDQAMYTAKQRRRGADYEIYEHPLEEREREINAA